MAFLKCHIKEFGFYSQASISQNVFQETDVCFFYKGEMSVFSFETSLQSTVFSKPLNWSNTNNAHRQIAIETAI